MKIEMEIEEVDAWMYTMMNQMQDDMIEEIKKKDPEFVPQTEEQFQKNLEWAKGKIFFKGYILLNGYVFRLRGPTVPIKDKQRAEKQIIVKLTECLIDRLETIKSKAAA
jgi:hypothetical protein